MKIRKFEYKQFETFGVTDVIKYCNELGNEGWEIIEMNAHGDYVGDTINDVYIFAKREIIK